MLRQYGFNLTELDAKAAKLDLLIDSAHVLDVAVREKARQITRLVQTGSWPLAKRVPEINFCAVRSG